MNIIKNSNQIDSFEPWHGNNIIDDTWWTLDETCISFTNNISNDRKINPISENVSKHFFQIISIKFLVQPKTENGSENLRNEYRWNEIQIQQKPFGW